MQSLTEVNEALRAFVAARDWDQFHTPKNLAMAIAGEAGELVAHFQWLSPEESATLTPAKRDAVALEAADVFLFLLSLCDKMQIDLLAAAAKKLELNAIRYPADKARGRAAKYDEL